ncbi:MAG TPA: hypothetical protein VNG33_00900, partial [Polyangiaceae bacterium]|nr:hypothetical protein [Polyangiaceae bacterium]
MRLHLFTFCGLSALLLGLTSACAGGQTGDLSGNKGPGTGGPDASGGCDEHKQKLASFDEMTDQGTAEQLLAFAEKSFDAPITWKTAAAGQAWTVAPESGQGTIHLDVTRGATAYQLTYSAPAQDNSGPAIDIGSLCPPPALGVEVHVSVTTDGGALAESYDTLLRSSTPGVATLSAALDLEKLGGSLAIMDANARGKVVQVSLAATLTAQGTTGSISGMEQVDSGSGQDAASSASRALLAVWPGSEACRAVSPDGDGLGISIDEPLLGVTGKQSIAALAPPQPAAITWMDDSKTTIVVGIEPLGDGCFRVRDDSPIELDGGPGISYPVTISLKSADGRLDGKYAGQVDVIGSGSEQRVRASADVALAVADLAKSGFASVNVPDGSESLLLEVDSMLSGGRASGSVHLFAISSPPCETTPPPTPTPG